MHTARTLDWRTVAAAMVTAVVLVAALTTNVTSASWTGETTNPDNLFGTATIDLVSQGPADGDWMDESSTAFTVTDMMPGDSETETVGVRNDSSVALDVCLYVEQSGDTELADHLNVTLEVDAVEEYNGTMANMPGDYGSSTLCIEPLGDGDDNNWEFTVELDGATPDDRQGDQLQADFVWEGHTTE